MVSVINLVRELDRRMRFGMGAHPILGHPSIAVTDVIARTNSLNAVPNQFTIFLDRRITISETHDEVLNLIKGLIPDYLQSEIQVEELYYDTPSYTGFTFPLTKYFPSWLLDDSHPLVQAGLKSIHDLWREDRPLGTWDFSTNGTYWAGKAGIPSIGFGPGDETTAHTINEQVSLEDVVSATEFYAYLPMSLANEGE
jgi:putative selenium metabolism hydrolase